MSILGDKLYIVMELIEGVPLAEHFNSLKEKQQQFTEDRLWNIFIQVTNASKCFVNCLYCMKSDCLPPDKFDTSHRVHRVKRYTQTICHLPLPFCG